MQPDTIQQIRDAVAAELDELVTLTDDTILLFQHARTVDGDATIETLGDEVAYLINTGLDEQAVNEYLILREHFDKQDNIYVRGALTLGLHHRACNREPLDCTDPNSLQRNLVLLKSITLLRSKALEPLLKSALAYSDLSAPHMEQGFRDDEFAELLVNNPQHWELLINTVLERGYEDGTEVFKNMITAGTPALMQGAL